MKNLTNTLRIENRELDKNNNSCLSTKTTVEEKKAKIKSRLALVYFVTLVTALLVLFIF